MKKTFEWRGSYTDKGQIGQWQWHYDDREPLSNDMSLLKYGKKIWNQKKNIL